MHPWGWQKSNKYQNARHACKEIACKWSHNLHKGAIGNHHIKPDTGVSIDHGKASQPGLLWLSKGVMTHWCYKYFSLYVDHDSHFLYSYFQEGKTAKTFKGKPAFEAGGVKIQQIHTDNGVFDSTLYKSDATKQNQTISFCSVNAPWQIKI